KGDELHITLGTTDADNAVRRVKLKDARDDQLSHATNGILQVSGFVPNPGLTGLLQERNRRRRSDTRRPTTLGYVVNPGDRLHIALKLQVQLQIMLRKGLWRHTLKPCSWVLDRIHS